VRTQRLGLGLVIAAVLLLGACNNDPTSPEDPEPPPGTPEAITGRERIGWIQDAADATELASLDFLIYVDGGRSVLQDASCSNAGGANGFPCSAALPAIAPGRHTLQIATLQAVGGAILESSRSAALEVTVTAAIASTPANVTEPSVATTSGGSRLRTRVLASSLDDPTDIAAHQDTAFVAERNGRIHRSGRQGLTLAAELTDAQPDAGGLLSIALHPTFQASRLLFAAYVADAGRGFALRIIRMREAGGVLGEAAVVFEEPLEEDFAHALLRFGPDARLYLAVGTGADPRQAQNSSDVRGKLLRLNADGTVPRDNPRASPVYTMGHGQVHGLAWDRAGSLWAFERDERGDEINRGAADANYGWPLVRGAQSHPSFVSPVAILPAETEVSGATLGPADTTLADDWLLASAGREGIVVLTGGAVDANAPVDLLFEHQFGRIGQLAAGRGGFYFVTANKETWGAGRDLLVRVDVDSGRRGR
jgi:glucose/arabinose dehydrogenase